MIPFAARQILYSDHDRFSIRRVGKLPVARQNWCARCPKIPDQAKDWPMWEKCVGCGEGLFAGDAFCGNCGRPVTPAVPAAREPDGLESAPLAVPTATPAADLVQVRIIPAGHDLAAPEQADPEQADSAQADSAQADPAQADPAQTGPAQPTGQAGSAQAQPPEQALAAVDPTAPENAAAPENAVAADRPAQPHELEEAAPDPGRRRRNPGLAQRHPSGPRRPGFPGPRTWIPSATPATSRTCSARPACSPGSTCSSRRSCGCTCCSAGRPGRPSGPPSGWR